MKNQFAVIFVLFALGCRQCASSLAGLDSSWYDGSQVGGAVANAGAFSPGIPGTGELFAPRLGSLGGPGEYYSQHISDSAASAESLTARTSYAIGGPPFNPLPNFFYGLENFFLRIGYVCRNIFSFVGAVTRKLLYIPLVIIRVLLLPVRIFFIIVRFGLKLLFLPITIGWAIFKFFTYPIRLILRKLFYPYSYPQYGVGVGGYPLAPSMSPYPSSSYY